MMTWYRKVYVGRGVHNGEVFFLWEMASGPGAEKQTVEEVGVIRQH